ncbi:MAG: NADAR family protein [Candidatus Moraniibacteriota bacterium]|nr:MAG: NADAR family protein [Candidatus Moranbacteria bacterium]
MDVLLLQVAAQKIESDGYWGLGNAAKLVGMPTALAILIAHLRLERGSKDTWPADPIIDEQVMELLMKEVPAVQNFLGRDCALFYADEWDCLQNFSAYAVEWRDRVWSTVEHAYQAAKYDRPDIIERIFQARSAHEAKKIGDESMYQDDIRLDWDEVKRPVMKEILQAKLAQHEYVRKILSRSHGMTLVEDTHRDDYWGRGPNWSGQNWLGKIWEEIRDEVFPA